MRVFHGPSINVTVKRLGGAYGGKITRNSWIAAACGLAAVLTNRSMYFLAIVAVPVVLPP